MPETTQQILKVTSVTATINPNGPSQFGRNDYYSGVVGRAGRQEGIFTTGHSPYYQGGHLISHSLIGKGTAAVTADKIDGYQNLAPMEAALNNIAYKNLESALGSSGPGQATITVTSLPQIDVTNAAVSWITGCPILSPAVPQGAIAVPSTVARNVSINFNANHLGDASEMPRMSPVANYIRTGADLLQHLRATDTMPWIDPALVAKINGL
jgi:hypothetical protein